MPLQIFAPFFFTLLCSPVDWPLYTASPGLLSFHWVLPVGHNGKRLKDNRLARTCGMFPQLHPFWAANWQCQPASTKDHGSCQATLSSSHRSGNHFLLMPLRLEIATSSCLTIFCLLLALPTPLEVVLLLNSPWLLYLICHLFPARNLTDVLLIILKLNINDNFWRQTLHKPRIVHIPNK